VSPRWHPSTGEVLLWGLATEVIAPSRTIGERLVVVLLLLLEVTSVADSVERVHTRSEVWLVKAFKVKMLI
jgi:hypothetical protein